MSFGAVFIGVYVWAVRMHVSDIQVLVLLRLRRRPRVTCQCCCCTSLCDCALLNYDRLHLSSLTILFLTVRYRVYALNV